LDDSGFVLCLNETGRKYIEDLRRRQLVWLINASQVVQELKKFVRWYEDLRGDRVERPVDLEQRFPGQEKRERLVGEKEFTSKGGESENLLLGL